MIKNKNSKELFEFVRTSDTSNVPSLKSILRDYDMKECSMEQLLINLTKNNKNILLIDARSEKEINDSSIPYSSGFPVLNNMERHNVGLIYKKYSQAAALWLALNYANPKLTGLKRFLQENNASGKNVFIYCWRGGGRSKYLSKMLFDVGYDSTTITGGHKSYRAYVINYFSQTDLPLNLLELSGLTGCGKSELLRNVSNEIPVIDLEEAARHYSSLLGYIPYQIRNLPRISNQSAFENNLFSQIYFNPTAIPGEEKISDNRVTYLIESESRKVGDFEIPKSLFDKMKTAPAVAITSSLENRVLRIVRDYFGDNMEGVNLMKDIFVKKEKFFKQQMSSKTYSDLISFLDAGKVSEFTEVMIKEYYDKKYKDKNKKPVGVISSDDIESASEELESIYSRYCEP